ncbi:hypothetical protein SK128_024793 [Halocaridina rubra]|uniref:CLOCK-interacting pacemaker n=1 Tax=Halocaridina rubra TaxID=373956 RepID=A0AAN8ZSR3_HALRR
MGIGVLDMVEMYTTANMCETQTLLPKEPVGSPGSCRGAKRRMSAASEDSGRPRSPRTPRSPKSPRSQRSEKYGPSPSPSPDRNCSRFGCTPPASQFTSTDTEDEEVVKRIRLTSPSSISLDSSSRSRESYESRRRRFMRTAEALRHSGLLDITMKTAELLRKNHELQKEIENLQKETRKFVLSVLNNPENRPILDSISSHAQLYEIIVPGSQGIMSVTSSSSLPEHKFPFGDDNFSSSEDDSLASNDNLSSPSPAPTESEGTSSLSEDSDSSEKENLTPSESRSSYKP